MKIVKSRLKMVGACLALALIAGLPQWVRAQTGTAMISGIVTDSSGAAVPDAAVVLQSTQESASRRTVTNSAGAYVMPAILPGNYQLQVTAQGFQAQTITKISLVAGQGSTLNAVLQVGAAITSVEVHETAPLLQTTSAAIGELLQGQELTELPTLGRNFTTLLLVLPSVVDITGDAGTAGVGGIGGLPVMYGLRPRYNNLTIDGFNSITPLFTTVGLYPPPEAIQEMKVDEVTDQGTAGWVPGANISVVTKSGTNTYHADVWEFLRNNALNAHSYFVPRVGTLRWNQFGFAGGGPLQIPHLLPKQKSWYVFGYYEGVRDTTPTNWLNEVPTTAEMQGDFSAGPPIYNPYTSTVDAQGALVSRQQFPGNIIPMGATNLCAPNPTCISPQSLALAKAFYPAPNLPPGAIPGVNYEELLPATEIADQWSTRVDHQFRQNDTFFGRFSYWRDEPSGPNGIPTSVYTNFTHASNSTVSDTHVFNPTTLLTLRFGVLTYSNPQVDKYVGSGDPSEIGGTLSTFPAFEGIYKLIPYISISGYNDMDQYTGFNGPEHSWEWSADSQKILGKHTLAFGGALMHTWFFTDNQTGTAINYSNLPTSLGSGAGDGFASYLLGLADSAGRVVGSTAASMTGNDYSLYFQDTFHTTKKLTLNMGIRWEAAPPLINKYGNATFEQETGQALWDIKNPITGQAANARRGLIEPDWHNFSPRLGIAYQLMPKTVVRASGGIFFATAGDTDQYEQGDRGNWPFAFPQSVSALNLTVPNAIFPNPFPGPAEGSIVPLGCQQCLEVAKDRSRTPYVEEWTFSVQQAITSSLMAEANYVGNHGVKLGGQILDNVATRPGTDSYTNRQPWPNFAPFVNNGYNGFSSWYDGLTLQLDWRASRNLTFLTNYAYQKTLDQVDQIENGNLFGMQQVNPTLYNLREFKGPASYSVGQVFHGSYIYAIPAHTDNRWLNAVVANWEHSGIVTADTGNPVFSVLTSDNENIGSAGGILTEFPNLVCNPSKGFQWSLSEAVNTSCYQLPAFGTAGNAGRHAIYGQGLRNWDAALTKRWPFAEKYSVALRADFFNLLNEHTFDPPNLNFGTSQFGTISTTSRQGGRQIQFSLKLHF
jgi:hypothetical protein